VHLMQGEHEELREKELVTSNKIRKAHGVPIIEREWLEEDIGTAKVKWHDGVRGIQTSHPVHLYKEIGYRSDSIIWEKDAFHFELSDSLQYRLLLHHHFRQHDATFERIKNELIIYQPAKFPPSHSKELSNKVADSVLNAWNLNFK